MCGGYFAAAGVGAVLGALIECLIIWFFSRKDR